MHRWRVNRRGVLRSPNHSGHVDVETRSLQAAWHIDAVTEERAALTSCNDGWNWSLALVTKYPPSCQILIKRDSPVALSLIPVSVVSAPGPSLLFLPGPTKSVFHTKWSKDKADATRTVWRPRSPKRTRHRACGSKINQFTHSLKWEIKSATYIKRLKTGVRETIQ